MAVHADGRSSIALVASKSGPLGYLPVLDFRPKKASAPNYLGRGEQRKLLMLVGLLGMVWIVMRQAKDPGPWERFFGAGNQEAKLAVGGANDPKIDPRIPAAAPGQSDVPAGAVRIVEGAEKVAWEKLSDIDPRQFGAVRDDTYWLAREHVLFFSLFDVLSRSTDEELAKASLGPVGFTQIYRQSAEYRGRIVSLRGTVHIATRVKAPENTPGARDYTTLVFEPTDRSEVMVIHTLEVPPEFPIAEKTRELVTLEAIFFKRWAYANQDEVRVAPVFLARSVRWEPRSVAGEAPARPTVSMGWTILAAVLFAALTLAVIYAATRKAKQTPYERTLARLSRLSAISGDAHSFPSSDPTSFPSEFGHVAKSGDDKIE